MKIGRCPWRLASRVTAALVFASTPALADVTKDQCVDANGKAQELRRDGKLSAAREQLRICISPSCPGMVRDDCTKRLDELEGAQPTIILGAKDGSGRDIAEVNVTVDGRPVAGKLDGTTLQVDPGQHLFTFTVKDQSPVTQTFIIREGEKGRREIVVIGIGALTAPVPAPTLAPAPAPSMEPPAETTNASTGQGLGTRKILGLAVGGAGVVGLALGSVFGAMTFSETSKQKTDCASPATCSSRALALSDHSTATTDGAVSTVAFVAGGVLLAGGAALFFLPSRSSEQPPAPALTVLPSVGPSGAFLSLSGGF